MRSLTLWRYFYLLLVFFILEVEGVQKWVTLAFSQFFINKNTVGFISEM